MGELNKTILEQLNLLKELNFNIDGIDTDVIPSDFSKIVFYKSDKQLNSLIGSNVTIVFEKYILKSYMDDFHNKFNNGCRPTQLIMHGKILKETEKMYYIDVVDNKNESNFVGWIPKKSMRVL